MGFTLQLTEGRMFDISPPYKKLIARKIMNKVRELGGSSTLREVKQPLRKSMTSNEFDSILEILVKAEELKETREGKTTRISFT